MQCEWYHLRQDQSRKRCWEARLRPRFFPRLISWECSLTRWPCRRGIKSRMRGAVKGQIPEGTHRCWRILEVWHSRGKDTRHEPSKGSPCKPSCASPGCLACNCCAHTCHIDPGPSGLLANSLSSLRAWKMNMFNKTKNIPTLCSLSSPAFALLAPSSLQCHTLGGDCWTWVECWMFSCTWNTQRLETSKMPPKVESCGRDV